MVILLLLLALTLAGIVGWILAASAKEPGIVTICVTWIVLVCIFGWGVLGYCAPQSKQYLDLPQGSVHIMKTPHIIVAVYGTQTITYNDAWSYIHIDSTTKWRIVSEINMYGFEAYKTFGPVIDSTETRK